MEPLLVVLATAECGVFSRVQALAAGYSDRRIRHLLAIGTWLRCHQGIFRLSGTPLTFDVSARIATLAAGPHAVLSHRVPGKLHRLDGTPEAVHWVSRACPPRQSRLGRVPTVVGSPECGRVRMVDQSFDDRTDSRIPGSPARSPELSRIRKCRWPSPRSALGA